MSKIAAIQIKNFRKFKSFYAVFSMRNTICLIGRGDSGKTTILDAISFCLAPSWNIPISDYDFYNCNVKEPIEISVVITGMPDEFKLMDKYGLYCSGWDVENQKIVDATEDGSLTALMIVLTVDESLEPKWEVVNHTSGERTVISAKDRARLNVYMISDFVNNHFAWANGSPLNSLSHATGESLDTASLLGVMRKIRESSKSIDFGDFSELLETIERQATTLGLSSGELSPAFDMKRLAVREGSVCLHNNRDLPLRLMGKGSRRLMSIAIQSAVSSGNGITLIDEIEQGLEPDRICHLVNTLNRNTEGQTFFTTHSGEALTEMNSDDVFWIKDISTPVVLTADAQGLVRNSPWAFFGRKVILCEGKTECGFCRKLGVFFESKGRESLSSIGVTIVNGEGSRFPQYAEVLAKLGMPFLLFCDSDEKTANARKMALAKSGVCVVEWADQDSFEQGIYKELPDSGVVELNKLACELKSMDGASVESARASIIALVQNVDRGVTSETLFADDASFSPPLRNILGRIAKGKKDGGGAWFKNITGGIRVCEIVCGLYDALPLDGYVKKNIQAIEKWIFDV